MSELYYTEALKLAQKEYRACLSRGASPFLPVMDDFASEKNADTELYYEFAEFNRVSGINYIEFSKSGSYAALQRLPGKTSGEPWTEEPIDVKLLPREKKPGIVQKVLGGETKRTHVAFVHDGTPMSSAWTRGHERGREFVTAPPEGCVCIDDRIYVQDGWINYTLYLTKPAKDFSRFIMPFCRLLVA